MLCAGLTVFSPLVRNGAGPGKKVGVIGIGGLVCLIPTSCNLRDAHLSLS
jgi:D-arabinose 1-dehydrogenase-like Zn-dependent alcohol dehydrogenase